MNQRTAKLLARYASRTGTKPRGLKREWQSLSRRDKTARRRTMKSAVDRD
jgi:hypothetical protein